MKLIKKYEKIITSNDNYISDDLSLSSKFFADIVDDFIKSRDRSRKIIITIFFAIIVVVLNKLTIITSSTSNFIKQSLLFAMMLRKFIVVVSALTMIKFIALFLSSSKTFKDISSFRKTLKKVFDNVLQRFARLLKRFKNKN